MGYSWAERGEVAVIWLLSVAFAPLALSAHCRDRLWTEYGDDWTLWVSVALSVLGTIAYGGLIGWGIVAWIGGPSC